MTAPQGGSETVHLDGAALGVLTFLWQEDRYQHHWRFPNSEFQIESLESDSSDLWPLSPPLQQIHQQSFDDGREVIFGVGMSGRGHWSASFTLVPDLKCWIVELACKSPIEPERLQSAYKVAGSFQSESESKVAVQDSPITLEAIAPSTNLKLLDSDELRLLPRTEPSADATSQWAFRLRVS